MYELQKYKVHITCSRNHWGWGYNNVFRKYAKTCIRENEGKIKYTAIVTVGGTKIFT